MKTFAVISVLFGLALAGCESVGNVTANVRERIAARSAPHTRVFAAPPRATYAAVRAAIDALGYRFLRGGPAQGELDAVSGLSTDNSLRNTRQITIKVRLVAVPEGTEARVTLTEAIEESSTSGAVHGAEGPLRDSPLYEIFFHQVEQALAAPKQG
jgi:hypothetical protein